MDSSHTRKNLDLEGIKNRPFNFPYIYSSDFASMCSRDESILHANHTVHVYVGASLEELTDHVNVRLCNILEWCNCNKLSQNLSKSVFMAVINEILVAHPQLRISSDLIREVSSFKYSGVHTDTWLKHKVKLNI